MANEVYAYLVLAFGAVVVVLSMFLVLRLLESAKDKPLPGSQSRFFNAAVVGIVSAVAVLLLLDVQLIMIFPVIVDPLRTLVEGIDIGASAIVAVALVILFFAFRRGKRS